MDRSEGSDSWSCLRFSFRSCYDPALIEKALSKAKIVSPLTWFKTEDYKTGFADGYVNNPPREDEQENVNYSIGRKQGIAFAEGEDGFPPQTDVDVYMDGYVMGVAYGKGNADGKAGNPEYNDTSSVPASLIDASDWFYRRGYDQTTTE